MAFSKDDRKQVFDFFENLLYSMGGGPVFYDNLRGHVSKAPLVVQIYVRKECKGENLLLYFKRRKNYFKVDMFDVSMKWNRFTLASFITSQNFDDLNEYEEVYSDSDYSNSNSRSRNTSCSSNTDTLNVSESSYYSDEMLEYEQMTRKYFTDYLARNHELHIDDIEFGSLPKKIQRYLTKYVKKNVVFFFQSYPYLFLIDDSCVRLVTNPSVVKLPYNQEPQTEEVKLSSIWDIDVPVSEQAVPETVKDPSEEFLENFLCCANFFVGILKKKAPIRVDRMTGYLSQAPDGVLPYLRQNYTPLKLFFQAAPKLFLINKQDEVKLSFHSRWLLKQVKKVLTKEDYLSASISAKDTISFFFAKPVSVENSRNSEAKNAQLDATESEKCPLVQNTATDEEIDKLETESFVPNFDTDETKSVMSDTEIDDTGNCEAMCYEDSVILPSKASQEKQVMKKRMSEPSILGKDHNVSNIKQKKTDPENMQNTNSKIIKTYENLAECFFTVDMLCFEIAEKEDILHIKYEYETITFFIDILKENCGISLSNSLKYLQSKLGQASKDVVEFLKHLYKGEKMKEFFIKNEEFVFDVIDLSVELSATYESDLQKRLKLCSSFVKTKKYFESLCGHSWIQLCKDIFNGLFQLSTFLQNKEKAKITRLCGLVSTMPSFQYIVNKWGGTDQSERLKMFLNHFKFFIPYGKDCISLSNEINSSFFVSILKKLSVGFDEDTLEVLMKADSKYLEYLSMNLPFKPTEGYDDLRRKVIESVKNSLNSKPFINYSDLPKVLHPASIHNLYNSKLWSPSIIWMLYESNVFKVDNGQIYLREVDPIPVSDVCEAENDVVLEHKETVSNTAQENMCEIVENTSCNENEAHSQCIETLNLDSDNCPHLNSGANADDLEDSDTEVGVNTNDATLQQLSSEYKLEGPVSSGDNELHVQSHHKQNLSSDNLDSGTVLSAEANHKDSVLNSNDEIQENVLDKFKSETNVCSENSIDELHQQNPKANSTCLKYLNEVYESGDDEAAIKLYSETSESASSSKAELLLGIANFTYNPKPILSNVYSSRKPDSARLSQQIPESLSLAGVISEASESEIMIQTSSETIKPVSLSLEGSGESFSASLAQDVSETTSSSLVKEVSKDLVSKNMTDKGSETLKPICLTPEGSNESKFSRESKFEFQHSSMTEEAFEDLKSTRFTQNSFKDSKSVHSNVEGFGETESLSLVPQISEISESISMNQNGSINKSDSVSNVNENRVIKNSLNISSNDIQYDTYQSKETSSKKEPATPFLDDTVGNDTFYKSKAKKQGSACISHSSACADNGILYSDGEAFDLKYQLDDTIKSNDILKAQKFNKHVDISLEKYLMILKPEPQSDIEIFSTSCKNGSSEPSEVSGLTEETFNIFKFASDLENGNFIDTDFKNHLKSPKRHFGDLEYEDFPEDNTSNKLGITEIKNHDTENDCKSKEPFAGSDIIVQDIPTENNILCQNVNDVRKEDSKYILTEKNSKSISDSNISVHENHIVTVKKEVDTHTIENKFKTEQGTNASKSTEENLLLLETSVSQNQSEVLSAKRDSKWELHEVMPSEMYCNEMKSQNKLCALSKSSNSYSSDSKILNMKDCTTSNGESKKLLEKTTETISIENNAIYETCNSTFTPKIDKNVDFKCNVVEKQSHSSKDKQAISPSLTSFSIPSGDKNKDYNISSAFIPESVSLHEEADKSCAKTSTNTSFNSSILQPLAAKIVLLAMDSCIAEPLTNEENKLVFCLKPTFHCDQHSDCVKCFDSLKIGDVVSCYINPTEETKPVNVCFPFMFCKDLETENCFDSLYTKPTHLCKRYQSKSSLNMKDSSSKVTCSIVDKEHQVERSNYVKRPHTKKICDKSWQTKSSHLKLCPIAFNNGCQVNDLVSTQKEHNNFKASQIEITSPPFDLEDSLSSLNFLCETNITHPSKITCSVVDKECQVEQSLFVNDIPIAQTIKYSDKICQTEYRLNFCTSMLEKGVQVSNLTSAPNTHNSVQTEITGNVKLCFAVIDKGSQVQIPVSTLDTQTEFKLPEKECQTFVSPVEDRHCQASVPVVYKDTQTVIPTIESYSQTDISGNIRLSLEGSSFACQTILSGKVKSCPNLANKSCQSSLPSSLDQASQTSPKNNFTISYQMHTGFDSAEVETESLQSSSTKIDLSSSIGMKESTCDEDSKRCCNVASQTLSTGTIMMMNFFSS